MLRDVYGDLLIVRPPVPATTNKAGANYKSEVTHLEYSPRRAYDEWLQILEGIVALGGDALYQFETDDERFLDHAALDVDAEGAIHPAGSSELLGHLDDVMTGRVFAANGPWVTLRDGALRAVMPNMLSHRKGEAAYYRSLLGAIDPGVEIVDNPHRWEGMADVAVVGERVVLTYAVRGHYDRDTTPKSERSSREGVAFAADFSGVPDDARVYAELVYPHFHGDTVHFGARPPSVTSAPSRPDGLEGLRSSRGPVLVHYPGGLFGDGAKIVRDAIGADRIVEISRDDAVEQYAGNSRQVRDGVLVPDGVSDGFCAELARLGLDSVRVPLFELFGKAGGGPACATLYLPQGLAVPADSPLRFSATRDTVRARRERIPEALRVDPGFFAGKIRG